MYGLNQKRFQWLIGFLSIATFAAVTAHADTCRLLGCSGLELKCGIQPPGACMMLYRPGDFCRKYARCELNSGSCQLEKSALLDRCLSCMSQCLEREGGNAGPCDRECRLKMKQPRPGGTPASH